MYNGNLCPHGASAMKKCSRLGDAKAHVKLKTRPVLCIVATPCNQAVYSWKEGRTSVV